MFSIRESSSSRKTARNWREKGDGRREDDKRMEKTWRRRERWEDTTRLKQCTVDRRLVCGQDAEWTFWVEMWKCGYGGNELWAVGNWAVENVQKPVVFSAQS
jgi:hypothetical protein